jgi:hypothetical protein
VNDRETNGTVRETSAVLWSKSRRWETLPDGSAKTGLPPNPHRAARQVRVDGRGSKSRWWGKGRSGCRITGERRGIPWAGRSQKTQPATWRWRWRLVPLQKALEHLWPIWRRNRRVSRGTRSRATAWVPP